MHNPQPLSSHAPTTPSTRSSGPLPKSDSVQSLVSLMNCSTNLSTSHLEDSTIRGVDGSGQNHSVTLTPDTEYVPLSGLGLATVTLSPLGVELLSRSIREISLAANDLEVVDLTPLQSCTALTVLSLNSNRIATLDISPLKSCTKLERLWLHDNCLESIDLSPISSCKALRSLYLEDNSLHDATIDLTPLGHTTNLRSLRLGGNRLGGKLDLTPLLFCPGLSVFNVDSSVSLISDGNSTQARVSSAFRRIVLDVKFTGKPIDPSEPQPKETSTSPLSSRREDSPAKLRRRITPPSRCSSLSSNKVSRQPTEPTPIVKVLLVGFRRLARYAAEDSFTRCGKIMIRASSQNVASSDPGLLLDSHLVILYAPSEKTMRQITVAVGRIPTVVIGTERYRSTADNRMLELLDRFNFYADPLDPEDTRVVYNMGKDYATGSSSKPSSIATGIESVVPLNAESSPVSEDDEKVDANGTTALRRSYSESSLLDNLGNVNIELEDIEDEEPAAKFSRHVVRRSISADRITRRGASAPDIPHIPATTWTEVTRRLKVRKGKKMGRGWGSYHGSEMSMHGKNKLRAEQAAVEVAFHDLGGHATVDTCAGLARACGLPKCAGPVLFKAAYASSFEIESTTPEAGVPNPPMERKNRRVSVEAFIVYWNSRLKAFDGEERLSNVLEDSLNGFHAYEGGHAGRSIYGAPLPDKSSSTGAIPSVENVSWRNRVAVDGRARGGSLFRVGSMSCLPTDISCPCDAGIESLIRTFMEGRSSRFGSFALVKMSEAVAIGSSLVMHGLRGASKNRVGGLARPVCPKEVREGKLNASLIAAEAGIFEGVASGLSMDQIRSVKGCFATEASPEAVSRNSGLALGYMLSTEEVVRFCISRKSLLPGAVKRTMAVHCRKGSEMSLGEFAVFLCVLNNLSSNGALDYFFTVVDTDHDELWTLPDLRHFHMEKERMWLNDGMAVSDLVDIWVNLLDMIRPRSPQAGISRRDLSKLGAKDRKLVLQSLLFADDDHSVLNIRRTMQLSNNSTSPLVM
eukprot:GFKZ01005224.1.p1 GENE.GFKZ01005224.1~~GFKZ01005224.1.p1  ORF type:complete len:1028 (+),score=114.02 GFKZ01005224.1:673-3756(+)